MHIFEHITTMRDKAWAWFVARADGPYAVFWLCVLSYFEPFISPVVPEALLVAMILAKREHWRWYTFLTCVFTFLGGMSGYFIGAFLFRGFGDQLLAVAGFREFHHISQQIVNGNIFLIMFFIAFTLVPDKPFTYLSGFLGAPILQYAGGFLFGRAMRIILVGYFVYRFGPQMVAAVNKYFFWFAMALLAILALYGIVHWHLVPYPFAPRG